MTDHDRQPGPEGGPIAETIARVRELDAAATKGPWHAGSKGHVYALEYTLVTLAGGPGRSLAVPPPDALLIAYYRDAAPQLAAEVERLRAENAELREALSPFAAMSDGLLPDPHPCSVRCWRVGGPCNTSGGVCEECGTRASRDDECVGLVTYGDTRRARAALAKGGG